MYVTNKIWFDLIWFDLGRPKHHPTKTAWNFRQLLPIALTPEGHYHHVHNFTVLLQPHCGNIQYIKHWKISFLTALGQFSLIFCPWTLFTWAFVVWYSVGNTGGHESELCFPNGNPDCLLVGQVPEMVKIDSIVATHMKKYYGRNTIVFTVVFLWTLL